MLTNLLRKNYFLLLLVGLLAIPAFFPDQPLLPTPVAAPVLSGSPPLSDADWVIVSDTVIRDENYTINGDIIVQNGANLTLTNVTLWMNSSVDGECSIWVNSGGEFYLHNCTVTAYNTSNAWFLTAKAGSTLLLNETTISYAGYTWDYPGLQISTDNAKVINCTIFRNYYGLWLYKANDTLIEDNSIALSSIYGIYAYTANNTILESNSITHSGSSGIKLADSSQSIVRGNTVTNSGYYGIALSVSGNSTVCGNTVINSSDYGIELYRSGSSIVRGNTVTNSSGGIMLEYSDDIIVSENTATNSSCGIALHWYGNNSIISGNTVTNSSCGIHLGRAGNNNRVAGNTVTNSSDDGIKLWHSANSTVSGNTITNSWRGIMLEFSGNNTVSGNTVTNTSTEAISLELSGNNTVSGNTVTKSGNGILLWHSGQSSISGNTVTNGYDDGIELYNSSQSTIIGNTITNSDNKGIFLGTSGNSTVSANNITNSDNKGIHLFMSDNSAISGNAITNSDDEGIYLYRSANNAVSGNTITNSTKDGVYLHNSSNNYVSGNTITNSSQHGIYLDQNTSKCLLWSNHLATNAGGNAYDGNGTNQWDNGTHGNWYDDYMGQDLNKDGIGDSPYSIGTGLGEDRYPLMNLVLPDTSPPTLDSPADVTYTLGTMWHTIIWYPSDANPFWYQILRNGTVIANTTWDGAAITLEIFGLASGTHNFTIVVFDRLGYRATDEVLVTVKPAEETTEGKSETITGFTLPLVGLALGICLFLIHARRRNRARS